jgi:hypothetical protein
MTIFGVSDADWISAIGALITGIAALAAVGLVGGIETRKLRSQHRQDERRRLQALIGRYHGPLLEAAIDFDRRMHQLYRSAPADPKKYGEAAEGLTEMEWFMDDGTNYNTDNWVYGKFCDPDQYMFRSFVFRFLVLCSLARQFEAEAFYHDAQVARQKDFQFLKYAKAFLWAPTHGDMHEDEIPGKDHFPNDEFRPILDMCYRTSNGADAQDRQVFDLDRLVNLVTVERDEYRARLCAARAQANGQTSGISPPDTDEPDDAEPSPEQSPQRHQGEAVAAEWPPGKRPDPRGIGRVIVFFIGLRRPTWREDVEGRLSRYNWDRLCVLHLLVMAFINEFGYTWQRRTTSDIDAAASEITDHNVARKFEAAIPSLGLGTGTGGRARKGMGEVERSLHRHLDPPPARA